MEIDAKTLITVVTALAGILGVSNGGTYLYGADRTETTATQAATHVAGRDFVIEHLTKQVERNQVITKEIYDAKEQLQRDLTECQRGPR